MLPAIIAAKAVMTKQSAIRNPQSAVAIVGAGPAGASLAIRLAMQGFAVTLIEKDRFPREKLCGEFISPECFRHVEELGVKAAMLAAGGDRITETRFFSPTGKSVGVPTKWFGHGEFALSLSRAEMDHLLLNRARSVGVKALDGIRVVGIKTDGDRIASIRTRGEKGERSEIGADVFIDATGRSATLARFAGFEAPASHRGKGFVGFKAHLTGVEPAPGVCQIYFFDGGYGGLSQVENGKANFCFIVRSKVARGFIGKTNQLFEFVVARNHVASQRLNAAWPIHDWLGVSVEGFGRRSVAPMENLFAVGDAGAFIDPFTGSGMLMAFESAQLLADCLSRRSFSLRETGARYDLEHRRLFRRRLVISSFLRRAAFMPKAASAAIFLASRSDRIREVLARGTRLPDSRSRNPSKL